jgi:hypothetical protein
MKINALIILIFCFNIAFSQTSNFKILESKTKSFASKNLWDDVLISATDLIIEEPTMPEGYYYTALAFLNLEDINKAKDYFNRASNFSYPEFEPKLKELDNQIKIFGSITSLERNSNKNSKEYWYKLWLLDNSNLEYVLNLVAFYIDNKQYQEALDVLKNDKIKDIKEIKNVISKIENTPEMKNIFAYQRNFDLGSDYFDKEDYSNAISYLNQALTYKKYDTKATELLKKAEDEKAWKDAKEENSITSYKDYLQAKTNQKYATDAHRIIKNSLIYWGEKAAKEGNIATMENHLFDYINRYPNGEDVAKAKQLLCDAYQKEGRKNMKSRTYSGQDYALTYYSKAQKYCISNYSLNKDIKRANRLKTRYGRPDRGFVAFITDSFHTIGLSMGTINNPEVGGYFSIKINPEIFSSSTYYTVDSNGVFDGNVFEDIRPTREEKIGKFSMMGGITKGIVYPLWLYAGVGFAHSVKWIEVDQYDTRGDYYSTEWVRNSDETHWNPSFETGLILDIGGAVNARGGIQYDPINKLIYSFGFGVTFRRY